MAGLVTQASPYLEHMIGGLRVEEVRHERHHERLRDRLVESDREWRVFVGSRSNRRRNEQMPWDVAHNRQHPLIQLRFADLIARQFCVYANHIDHVSAKDRQMFLRQGFHRAVSRLLPRDHRLTLPSPQAERLPFPFEAGCQVRVLIVEDDSSVAQSLELMLKSEGFNPYSTDLGHEAVELAKIYDYDVVLLDLNLPDMSGYDVLRSLRVGKVKTPVLILSFRHGFALGRRWLDGSRRSDDR